jgi:hypothetical protein
MLTQNSLNLALKVWWYTILIILRRVYEESSLTLYILTDEIFRNEYLAH